MNIGKEVAILKRMTVPELRRKHAEVFGERPRSGHKDYLVKRIAWRLRSLPSVFGANKTRTPQLLSQQPDSEMTKTESVYEQRSVRGRRSFGIPSASRNS